MTPWIRKTKIKQHIARAIDREKAVAERNYRKALAEQQAHFEQMLQRQSDEYEAIIESADRQISALKADARDNERMIELIRSGAKGNNRIAAELVGWAERFMKTGAQAYQEINAILDETAGHIRRLEK